jgi:hypothetical protein
MAQTVGLEKPSGYQRYIPMHVLDVLKTVATDPNHIACEMEEEFETSYEPGAYFRFNVEQGMQGITLELGQGRRDDGTYEPVPKDHESKQIIGRAGGYSYCKRKQRLRNIGR